MFILYIIRRNCTVLTKSEFGDFMQSGFQEGTCMIYAEFSFIFYLVGNYNLLDGSDQFYKAPIFNDPDFMQKKMFHLVELYEDKENIPCVDIYPDNYFNNEISYSVQCICNYLRGGFFQSFLSHTCLVYSHFIFLHMNIRGSNKLIQFLSNLTIRNYWIARDLVKLIKQRHFLLQSCILVRPGCIHGGISLYISTFTVIPNVT